MDKPANTRYPIHDLLRQRWSPRAFANRRVGTDALRSLLEAARWAPSSRNEQPWRLIVESNEHQPDHERLVSCLMDGNSPWAQRAPVLMVAVARVSFEDSGKPNRHALYDVGQAVANLTVQATELGLFVHQMAGFYPERVRELYGIPPEFEPVTVIALGYAGDPASLPERLKERELAPRERKLLAEFVFTSAWGRTSTLL